MTSPFKIFIGYEEKQAIAYDVLRYSIIKHSSLPVDIQPLIRRELQQTINFNRDHDPLQSTEFTYTRFLVPFLCGFRGKAVYMDCDMVCLGDIAEIFNLDLAAYWLRVVKHDHRPENLMKMDGKIQTKYPRKNWSSFMLLNSERLKCWSTENVEGRPAKWLHRFEPVPDEAIGEIPPDWNVLDHYDSATKLIHYTEGGPWLPQYSHHPYGELWFRYRDEYRQARQVLVASSAERTASSRI